MPTTKRKAPAAAETATGTTVNLGSIVLASVRSERNFDPHPDDTGNAIMTMRVEPVEGFPTARMTLCSVEFKDSNDDVLVAIESKFRAEFQLADPAEAATLDDHISGLALRVTYPYHRQIISSLVAQSGLPGVVLPLVANEDLDDLATRRR